MTEAQARHAALILDRWKDYKPAALRGCAICFASLEAEGELLDALAGEVARDRSRGARTAAAGLARRLRG